MKTVLIGLGGASSSGKTITAKALCNILRPFKCSLVHLDDFYLSDDQIPIDETYGIQNWDCVEAIDFPLFKQHLRRIKDLGKVEKIDSLELDAGIKLDTNEIQRLRDYVTTYQDRFNDYHLVLVDGFMLYHDRDLLDLFDVKLFFYASFQTLKTRRESREGYQTVDGFWQDPPGYFENIVWPSYVATHSYLFEGNNIEANLTSFAKEQLHIIPIRSDSLTLYQLVELSLKEILIKL